MTLDGSHIKEEEYRPRSKPNAGQASGGGALRPTTSSQSGRTRSSRQVPGGQATSAHLSDDPARAKETQTQSRREQKEALVAAVACPLEGGALNSCGLSKKALLLTIQSIRSACRGSAKCGWRKLDKHRREAIYRDWSDKTVMEACDGTMPAIEVGGASVRTRSQRGLLQLKTASELFKMEVLTSALAEGTRKRYFPVWKGFRTFGIEHGALTRVMPTTREIV
jgi:hypothetical protein